MNYQYPPDFIGDGRIKVRPTHQPMGTRGVAVTRATARMIIDMLFAQGQSTHSPLGDTVWVVQLALHYNMRSYTLRYENRMGFHIKIEEPI